MACVFVPRTMNATGFRVEVQSDIAVGAMAHGVGGWKVPWLGGFGVHCPGASTRFRVFMG